MSNHPDELALSLYADGELPVDDVPALEAHLASCPECRAVVAETQWFSGLLKLANARRQPARATFDPEALATLLAEHPQQPRSAAAAAPEATRGQLVRPPRSRWRVPLFILGAAAVVVLASLASLCGGAGGLAACTGGSAAPGGSIAAGGGATPAPPYGAGTVMSAATATEPGAAPVASVPEEAYPGATITNSLPIDISLTATALAVAGSATSVLGLGATGTPGVYPPPATRTALPPAPVRLTRAAVIAGLPTDVAEGVAMSVWLPWVGLGR